MTEPTCICGFRYPEKPQRLWNKEEAESVAAHQAAHLRFPTSFHMSDEAFDEAVRVLTSGGEPSEAAKRGAALLRKLYGDR